MKEKQADEKQAIDEAIEIIVNAMNDVEADSDSVEYWYLPYLQLERIFYRFCREKYFPE